MPGDIIHHHPISLCLVWADKGVLNAIAHVQSLAKHKYVSFATNWVVICGNNLGDWHVGNRFIVVGVRIYLARLVCQLDDFTGGASNDSIRM